MSGARVDVDVDPESRFGLPTRAGIEAIVATRACARLLARQERGLPITHNIIASICRDEANRFFDERAADWLAKLAAQPN